MPRASRIERCERAKKERCSERHVHHGQDETFFFLEGSFDVEIDGVLYRMEPGDVGFVPREAVHAFKNVGTTKGRIRYIFSPALKIEEMFRAFYVAQEKGNLTELALDCIFLFLTHTTFD